MVVCSRRRPIARHRCLFLSNSKNRFSSSFSSKLLRNCWGLFSIFSKTGLQTLTAGPFFCRWDCMGEGGISATAYETDCSFQPSRGLQSLGAIVGPYGPFKNSEGFQLQLIHMAPLFRFLIIVPGNATMLVASRRQRLRFEASNERSFEAVRSPKGVSSAFDFRS